MFYRMLTMNKVV